MAPALLIATVVTSQEPADEAGSVLPTVATALCCALWLLFLDDVAALLTLLAWKLHVATAPQSGGDAKARQHVAHHYEPRGQDSQGQDHLVEETR